MKDKVELGLLPGRDTELELLPGGLLPLLPFPTPVPSDDLELLCLGSSLSIAPVGPLKVNTCTVPLSLDKASHWAVDENAML